MIFSIAEKSILPVLVFFAKVIVTFKVLILDALNLKVGTNTNRPHPACAGRGLIEFFETVPSSHEEITSTQLRHQPQIVVF
ncbi:hypothetical protein D3C83_64490 [compost metagenome]